MTPPIRSSAAAENRPFNSQRSEPVFVLGNEFKSMDKSVEDE